MPEGLIVAIVAGMSGGLLGSLIGAALASDRVPFPRGIAPKLALAAAVAGLFLMVGYGLHVSHASGVTTTVALQNLPSPKGERYVSARVTLHPPGAAKDAKWLTVTAWQGHKKLVVDRLKPAGAPGVYRTTEPIPAYGDWKALVRLQTGDKLLGTPIYLPNDPAIPVKGVPATPQFTRPLGSDHKILQREAKNVSGILPLFAYLAVLSIALGLCALIAWGLGRLARDGAAGLPDEGAARAPRQTWIERGKAATTA